MRELGERSETKRRMNAKWREKTKEGNSSIRLDLQSFKMKNSNDSY
jgi:hypothetical protein